MRGSDRQVRPGICRILFRGVGPSGPGWANFLLVEAAQRAGAAIFPPSAVWILPLFFFQLWGIPEAVSLFGYSRGGASAVRFARFLAKERIRVVLLYLIDPVVLCGRSLSIPPSVERTFCCRQRNGARLWLLPGRLGRGAPCRGSFASGPIRSNPENKLSGASRLEEEEAALFPDGRTVRHEDMIRYALDYARFPLEHALTFAPEKEEKR